MKSPMLSVKYMICDVNTGSKRTHGSNRDRNIEEVSIDIIKYVQRYTVLLFREE